MNSHIADILAPIVKSASQYKQVGRLLRKLPPNIKTYDYTLKVTFNYLTPEQNINHAEYAKIFGHVREVMGLAMIPNFKEEVGKVYMLKTKAAHYELRSDFYFGDEIFIKMFISELTPFSFRLYALYTDKEGGVRATGSQKIAHTSMTGQPCKMSDKIYNVLTGLVLEI